MAKHKPAASTAPKRGRGRPSKVELALRAATAQAVPAPPVVEAVLSGPPEPSVKPILPPAPPPPPPVAPPAPAAQAEQDVSAMSSVDREDPRKLYGQALRDFAHARGISRSEMSDWADEKVRQQVSLIIHRQYHEYV